MRFTIAYTILFIYVILAIIWWGYALMQENEKLYELRKEHIELKQELRPNLDMQSENLLALNELKRNEGQYWGEGLTFLGIILISSIFVYRAYYKQRKLGQMQRNFMMSVTHELKTPLAGIILNMQTMMRRQVDDSTQQKLVGSSETEARRLSDLCNNILIATQIEDGESFLTDESCELGFTLKTVIEEYQERSAREIELELPDEKIQLDGSSDLWKLVFSNLIGNADKYSPPEHPIKVALKNNGKKWVASVADKGIGISDADKKKIFQKFYRVGNENTRNTKGTGIGLYLVKKLVRAFNYDIRVKNNVPHGSIFEVLI